MVTITEDFVSFETAKLLRDKGFDETCYACYEYFSSSITMYSGWPFEYKGEPVHNTKDRIKCPTLQMAMKWLREVHTIDIVITPSMFRRKYNVCIYKEEKLCCIDFDGDTLSPSYEQACKSAIKYCLENLI